jgi:phosphopantothenoylcysteine synthetase/decarboxylase
MKALITLGGTRESIDAARFITNLSTGRTGRVLAESLAAGGCEVICLCAAGAEKPKGENIRVREFTSFKDLDLGLKRLLKAEPFDAVIHLAAVSDYSPSSIEAGGRSFKPGGAAKLDSSAPMMTLTLKKNFKIIDRIKNYAAAGGHPEPLLIGFKLTSGAARALVLKKVRALGSADLVAHNDLEEMKTKHVFHIYRGGVELAALGGAEKLADYLYSEIKNRTEALCS